MRHTICFLLVIAFATPASAACELATGPCSTDGYGNTFRTEQNLGGGYTTYQNGQPYSQTNQNLNGGYQERFNDGSTRSHNYNPYDQPRNTGTNGPRYR